MKLKAGQSRYKFPDYEGIIFGVVEGNQKYNQGPAVKMAHMAVEAFSAELDSRQGFPTVFCVWRSARQSWISFWPIPDHSYKVRIRFTPPIEEY